MQPRAAPCSPVQTSTYALPLDVGSSSQSRFSFLLSSWHFLASLAILNSIAIHCHRCWGHKSKWHTIYAVHFFSNSLWECMICLRTLLGATEFWFGRRDSDTWVQHLPLGLNEQRRAYLNRSGHGMNRRRTSVVDGELDNVWMSGQFCKSGSYSWVAPDAWFIRDKVSVVTSGLKLERWPD